MDLISAQPVMHADLTIGFLIVAAAGFLILSRFFLKGSRIDQEIQEDDTPTTLASRGVFINVVCGTRRLGPLFGWAGRRITKEEVVGSVDGGGKGGGGGGGEVTQTVYFEDGWHILCMGPASVISDIFENGKSILETPLSIQSAPSGSVIETEVGSFKVFWGIVDQPVDDDLSERLGINSRWPYVCSVLWIEKRLGTGPTWPSMEYVVTALGCADNDNSIGTFEPTLTSGNESGINPAFLVYQFLTGAWPHGAGIDPDLLDITTLDAIGNLFSDDEGDDFLPMNLLISEGNNDIERWIQAVLLDAGFFMVDHPSGRLVFLPIREPVGTLPVVSAEYQTQPEVEVEIVPFDDVNEVNRVIFTFKDRSGNYRDETVEFGDDGVAEVNRRYRIAKIRLDTVTDKVTARRVANRRAPEALGDLVNIRYRVVRGASLFMPGQVFQDAEGRVVRVISSQKDTTSPESVLDCALDTYGLPALDDADDAGIGGVDNTAVADTQFTFVELPASVSGTSSIAIGVLRSRKNRRQAGATIWGSIDDGATYTQLGTQNSAAAGFSLLEAIDAEDGPDLIEEGPLLVGKDFDANTVLNLAGQVSSWQNGRQLMVVEDSSGNVEAFFLREIELQPEDEWEASTLYNVGDYIVPTANNSTGLRYRCVNAVGSQLSNSNEPDWSVVLGIPTNDADLQWTPEHFEYRALGLIRERLDSTARSFVIGDKVWIIEASRISALRSPSLLTPGEDLCIKTQPFTSSETFNIDNSAEVCKTLTGAAVAIPGLVFVISADGEQIVSNIGDRLVGRA
jgi:hypothetical protein